MFGREICRSLPEAEHREWLVTNGIGGYAMGTVAGLQTRRYHGLLVAALESPLGRTLLLSKVEETALYGGQEYLLFANRWRDGTVEPRGYRYLERFHLMGTIPVWRFSFANGLLEKSLWMEHGANTTYIQYLWKWGTAPVSISANILVNFRDYHATTEPEQLQMKIQAAESGIIVTSPDNRVSLEVICEDAQFDIEQSWQADLFLAQEDFRGQKEVLDSHLLAGRCTFTLHPSDSVTLVATIEDQPNLDGAQAKQTRRRRDSQLLEQARPVLAGRAEKSSGTYRPRLESDGTDLLNPEIEEQAIEQLVLAADQFIVHRDNPVVLDGLSVIAGYPWFGDWGRDTMIALSGLTLATGRPRDAAKILLTYSQFVDQGMLPNRFPDEGQEPEYNTVDATLWYYEAIRAYYANTGDDSLVQTLFPILSEIVDWHLKGTRHNIQVDPIDGLLYAGETGVQLTWMDAEVGEWVVTPRIGKPIEVNALWFNALQIMGEFAQHLGQSTTGYDQLARRVQERFARFWNSGTGYCYDVLDGPHGNDPKLRPNQLLAVSLPYSPLLARQQKAIVDCCSRFLLTPFGLRSLASSDGAFISEYGGDQEKRDSAYHQGTVWGWLMGPFTDAYLRVNGDHVAARAI